MIHPIHNLGLPENEERLYLYLIALQELSAYAAKLHLTIEEVHSFIEDSPAAKCQGTASTPGCGRWYLAEVIHCPTCGVAMVPASREELLVKIGEWERFRRSYAESPQTSLKLNRANAIRLEYYKTHQAKEVYS